MLGPVGPAQRFSYSFSSARTKFLAYICSALLYKYEIQSLAVGVGGDQFDADFVAERVKLPSIFAGYGVKFFI